MKISTQKYFVGCVVTKEKIAEAKAVYDAHLGQGIFNEEGFHLEYVAKA